MHAEPPPQAVHAPTDSDNHKGPDEDDAGDGEYYDAGEELPASGEDPDVVDLMSDEVVGAPALSHSVEMSCTHKGITIPVQRMRMHNASMPYESE